VISEQPGLGRRPFDRLPAQARAVHAVKTGTLGAVGGRRELTERVLDEAASRPLLPRVLSDGQARCAGERTRR
jgi:hypothetical protein